MQEELFIPGPGGSPDRDRAARDAYAAERSSRLIADPDSLLLVQDPPAKKARAERGTQLATLPGSSTTVGTADYLYHD